MRLDFEAFVHRMRFIWIFTLWVVNRTPWSLCTVVGLHIEWMVRCRARSIDVLSSA